MRVREDGKILKQMCDALQPDVSIRITHAVLRWFVVWLFTKKEKNRKGWTCTKK